MDTCSLHCQKSPGWVLMCHLCCALLPVAVLFVSVCCHLNSCRGAVGQGVVCHLGVSGPLSHCRPRAAVPCTPGSLRPRAQPMPWVQRGAALEQSVVPTAVRGACAGAAAQALPAGLGVRLWGVRLVEGLVPRKTVLL